MTAGFLTRCHAHVCAATSWEEIGKDKKKIEKERGKGEAYRSIIGISLSSLLSSLKIFLFLLLPLLLIMASQGLHDHTLSVIIIFASNIVYHYSLDLKAIRHQTVYKFPKIRVVLLLSCRHVCKTHNARDYRSMPTFLLYDYAFDTLFRRRLSCSHLKK